MFTSAQSPRQPLRCCVSCRLLAPRSQFWRVVRVASSQQVQLDLGMGRSAYLCRQSRCLQDAQKKNRLGRALRASIPPHIYEVLWQRLASPH
ncbi:MAG: YlxR family protein [Cyanobacteriota bacterium]|nr:YlxR family protein [Cyanobacteriota bacterium]